MQTNIRQNTARLAGLLIIGASLAACGGGGGSSETSTPQSAGATTASGTSSATEASAASAPASTTAGPTSPASSPAAEHEPEVMPPAADTTPAADTAPAADTPPATTNHAPTISGSAITHVVAGQAYSFVPFATDADGDNLEFAISSKPSWATFDFATGRLYGVPTGANVGSHEDIEISVTDGKTSTALPQFNITVEAAAGATRDVTVSWQPPTTNEDGTALTDLNGYRILYGTTPGVYSKSVTVSNVGLTSYTLENLATGANYYVAMVAVNVAGAESEESQEVVVDLT